MPTDPRFGQVLEAMQQMHNRKGADYGLAEDPYHNVRSSEEWGIPGWVGAAVRGSDKDRRLQKVAKGEALTIAEEKPLDDLIDKAVYAVIAVILFDEEHGQQFGPPLSVTRGHTMNVPAPEEDDMEPDARCPCSRPVEDDEPATEQADRMSATAAALTGDVERPTYVIDHLVTLAPSRTRVAITYAPNQTELITHVGELIPEVTNPATVGISIDPDDGAPRHVVLFDAYKIVEAVIPLDVVSGLHHTALAEGDVVP